MLDHSVLQAQIYISALAEEGSFSRAAKRLHTAQTFLTKKIAEIERDLEKALVDNFGDSASPPATHPRHCPVHGFLS